MMCHTLLFTIAVIFPADFHFSVFISVSFLKVGVL